jgi:transposase-like protein
MIKKITKWLCKVFTKEQIISLIEFLIILVENPETNFKIKKPNHPNYRKFKVDETPPITYIKQPTLDYKKLLKAKNTKPVKHKPDRVPPKHLRCPHCNAPYEYLYINNGKESKSVQYQCKICKKTFCETQKQRVTKYLCPHCQKALYKWKETQTKTIYKCDNDNCPKYLENLSNLTEKEKILQKEKPSSFKLRYNFRDYKISIRDVTRELIEPINNLKHSRYSSNTIGLILTFYITLGLSSRKTAFALINIFGIKISHMTVIRIAKQCSKICHYYNQKNIPKVPGKQAIDETYIKVKGKFHYVWLSIAKFRSIITSYQVSDTRSELPAIKSLIYANEKFQPDEDDDELTIIADGNPSYQAGQTFLKKKNIFIKLKKVIGLENKDEESKTYRYLKNLVERVNRTYKSYAKNCFGDVESASEHLALAITDYNFLRPHSSLDFETPVKMEHLNDAFFIQDKWAQIINSV